MTDKKPITVELLKAGVSSRTGLDYTDAVALFDFDRLNKRKYLFGEHRMPDVVFPIEATRETNKLVREEKRISVKHAHNVNLAHQAARILQIELPNVSHVFTNLRYEDGFIKAEVAPTGVYGSLFEKLQEMGKLHFGMRGFVELDGMKVKKIREIVTFDLVSTPL